MRNLLWLACVAAGAMDDLTTTDSVGSQEVSDDLRPIISKRDSLHRLKTEKIIEAGIKERTPPADPLDHTSDGQAHRLHV